MAVTFQDYINYITTSKTLQPRVKIEFLRTDETVDEVILSDVLGGNLTINRNNGVRRNVTITFNNSDGSFAPDRYRVWVNKKFKLELGYNINGKDFFLPQGVFVMMNPQYDSSPSGGTVTISGADKFVLLNGETGNGTLLDIYQVNVGTNINNGIRTILTDFKDPKYPLLQDTTRTTPYTFRKGYGSNVGEILKEFAYVLSRNIYYNEVGQLVFEDDRNDDIKASLFDYNYANNIYTYLGASYEADFSGMKNVVKVIGDNVNGVPVSGIAENTNPLSPTNINIPQIGKKVEIIDGRSELQTNTDCVNLAKFLLKRINAINASVQINSVPMFHLDVDNIITLTDSKFGMDKERLLINTIDIDLSFGGTMSLNVVKSNEVDISARRS